MKAFAVATFAALLCHAVADAQTPAKGRVNSTVGTCVIVRTGAAEPFAAAAGIDVLPGDRVHCTQGSWTAVELPGSRREFAIRDVTGYLVPAAPRHAPPPSSIDKGGIGGRISNIDEQRLRRVPDPASAPQRVMAGGGVLEHCNSPLGTVSLMENRSADWYGVVTQEYKLPPASTLLRSVIQQSNCFVIVERGGSMNALDRQRALMQSGEMRSGSNFGRGQMVASDFAISPEVIFRGRDGSSGEPGALVGAGRYSGVMAAIGGTLRTREADATLTLIDNRSGVEVGVSEGRADATDVNALLGVAGAPAAMSISNYLRTPQGKIIGASLIDSYNQLVLSVRDYIEQSARDQGAGAHPRLNPSAVGEPRAVHPPVSPIPTPAASDNAPSR